MSFFSDLFGGGDSEVSKVELPTWEQDPLYQSSQDILFPFASDLLKGIVPDYYKAIGETGSSEFENMLGLVNRDTSKAVNENLAKRGISRGGLGASIAAKSAADVNTKLRWSDFERALTGKQSLLNLGVNTMSGVRDSALNITGMKNNFNLSNFDNSFKKAETLDTQQAQTDAMWGELLKSGISAAGMLATGGGSALGSLGSAASSGGSDAISSAVWDKLMNGRAIFNM